MTTFGERLKAARTHRELTQKQLGIAVGFDEKTADIRIAQYECGLRYPKSDMVSKMAEALNTSTTFLDRRFNNITEAFSMLLLELDENYPVSITECVDEYDNVRYSLSFSSEAINKFLAKLFDLKKKQADGTISGDDYMDWKIQRVASSSQDRLEK